MKDENVVKPTGKIKLFTVQQSFEYQLHHRQSDFEGDNIVIIPDWVVQAIQAGRIK